MQVHAVVDEGDPLMKPLREDPLEEGGVGPAARHDRGCLLDSGQQLSLGHLVQIASVCREAEGNSGQQVGQLCDQRWIVREVRMQVADRDPVAPFLPPQDEG